MKQLDFLRSRRVRIVILTVLLLLLVAGGAACAFFMRSFNGAAEPVYVYIDADDDADSLRAKLLDEGRASSSLSPRCVQLLQWGTAGVRPGRYDVGSGQSVLDVARRLRRGQQSPLRLTIPCVWRSQDLAGRLSRVLMADSAALAGAMTDAALLCELGTDSANVVGLCLANTYEVYWTVAPADFLRRMKRESDRFWTNERRAAAERLGLTPAQVVTLASIVDKETAAAAEQPRVAGMYLNRLRTGMKLQADPTVKFALGRFDLRRILHEHLTVDSPYNTYRYEGLPPGPICLPSLQSIEAVLRAEQHDYLYMCAKEDFSGTHNFARTYDEHMANARRYRAALNARGIK